MVIDAAKKKTWKESDLLVPGPRITFFFPSSYTSLPRKLWSEITVALLFLGPVARDKT